MKFVFILLLLIPIFACSEKPTSIEKIHGQTMGTSYTVQWLASSTVKPRELKVEIDELLKMINQQMSTYQPDSELSLFNSAPAPTTREVSPELYGVLQESLSIHALTNGYFDITVGPVVNLWGFGPDKMPTHLPTEDQTLKAKESIGIDAIELHDLKVSKSSQRYLDLSAIAKGYGVDKVADLLEDHGIESYLVEIGGEMRAKGEKANNKPWRVAVEKPDENERSVQKIIEMKNGAMATSGDYRNYFEMNGEHYSHTIDPYTAKPVKHTLASVTVIDETCARADALATAMLVMGADKAKVLADKLNIKAYLIERDGSRFKEYSTPAFIRWQSK